MRTNQPCSLKLTVKFSNVVDLPITEEIYISALEAKSTEWAKVFYKIIQNAFPESLKLVKLKGMKYETDGNFERAL